MFAIEKKSFMWGLLAGFFAAFLIILAYAALHESQRQADAPTTDCLVGKNPCSSRDFDVTVNSMEKQLSQALNIEVIVRNKSLRFISMPSPLCLANLSSEFDGKLSFWQKTKADVPRTNCLQHDLYWPMRTTRSEISFDFPERYVDKSKDTILTLIFVDAFTGGAKEFRYKIPSRELK